MLGIPKVMLFVLIILGTLMMWPLQMFADTTLLWKKN